MRNGIVYVDGRKVNLNGCETLYADGRFHGSRGVRLLRTPKKNLVWEKWTNWQGEDDCYTLIAREEAIEKLQGCCHPDRVAWAIEALGGEFEEL